MIKIRDWWVIATNSYTPYFWFDRPVDTQKVRETPCPICGEKSYTWGKFEGRYLSVKGLSLFGGLKSRHCSVCGNIQLFGNT